MPSADLREVMRLTGRRGPTGRLWLEGRRGKRRFVVFAGKGDEWVLFERLGHPAADEPTPEAGARPSAPPPQPSRRPLRRMKRDLTSMGLIEASDHLQETTR